MYRHKAMICIFRTCAGQLGSCITRYNLQYISIKLGRKIKWAATTQLPVWAVAMTTTSAGINFEEVTETPPLRIRNVHLVIVDYSNEYSSQQWKT